ncbi:MAG: tetratricopeptide repeat protein [Deltaproteobacteria bacterium]|nr:tetratricopeptide repeat protein [Deltaproteobacteria bacterium]
MSTARWFPLLASAIVLLTAGAARADDPPPPPPAGAAPAGVSPTAPQAEDGADVGDAPGAATAPVAEPERPAALPWDDATLKERYEALRDAVRAYEREAAETRDEVRKLSERKYKERRAAIEENYRKAIEPVVKAERGRRLDAIATFERFLERHPNDQEFTPDAIFRLAELYFEKYDDEHQLAMKEWKDAYKRWEEGGKQGEPPSEPAKHFEQTIALYRRLIAEYPEYRLLDGAYYLLGYTLRAQGSTEEGVATWLALVDRFPKSRFYPEVWFRIGDQYFDEEKWEQSIAAFLNVVPLRESEYYDKALYKLAWTYYLVSRYDESVQRFFELLDFSFANRDKQSGESGSVLEDEAVQYVAISFGDDGWKRPGFTTLVRGASLDDPDAEIAVDYVAHAKETFKRTGEQKPFERDVMARLGQNLFKQSKHAQAVAALSFALELDPMHRDAPKLQDMVVQAWVRERQFDKANAARDVLVANYGKGTPWYKRFGNDSEALNQAETLARTNLYSAALYYHQQASEYYSQEKQEVALQYFKAASTAYKNYLERYPHDKNAYELSYYLAETFYYSLRFEDAVAQYEAVRDSPAGTRYRGEAGLNAVYAYEKIIEQAVQTGRLEKREIFAGGKRDANVKPEPIPELRQKYITAIDRFLERGADHEMAPNFGYHAGEVLYSYGHYDEAVKRFQIVVDKFPQSEAAASAANLILDDLVARKDWTAAASYAERFEKEKVGGGDTAVFAKIKGGAEFEIAKGTLETGAKLLDEGRIQEGNALLEKGADSYLKLIAEDPKREFADKMMYNAALSLEKARRPIKAAALYERLYKEYPDSENAPEAMFRVASKSEQVFEFDKAVTTYLTLVKTYPKSERRPDAQINAALALEGQQKYERAAQEFERFATMFPDRPEAPDVFYQAANVHKKRGAPGAELDVLNRFIKRYESRAAQAPKIVEAYARMGEIYDEQAKGASDPTKAKKRATESYQAAVRQFDRARGSPAASYFAAKSAFALAEQDYARYAKLAITSKNSKVQMKELEAKSTRLVAVENSFKGIITTYKAAEWSLASLYRVGALYDNLQQTVLKSPCPDDVRRLAGEVACDEYRNLIEDRAFAVEEKAVEAYRTALTKAKELRLQNSWTRRTLEAANLLRPAEFPIDKEPLSRPLKSAVTPLGPALPDGGAPTLKALGPGPGEAAQKGSSG